MGHWPSYRPSPNAARHAAAPEFLAAPGRPSSSPPSRVQAFLPSNKSRGRSAERRILQHPRLPARAPVATGARRSALHRGFSVPGAVASGRGREGSPSLIRAAFAALRPRRVQPTEGRSPVVGTDGDPGPPECEVTSLARGRRTNRRRVSPDRPKDRCLFSGTGAFVAPSSKRLAKTPSMNKARPL